VRLEQRVGQMAKGVSSAPADRQFRCNITISLSSEGLLAEYCCERGSKAFDEDG
jgi:hypothetical protein